MKKLVKGIAIVVMVVLMSAYITTSYADSSVSRSWAATKLNEWLRENGMEEYVEGYASDDTYHFSGVCNVEEIEASGYKFSIDDFPTIYETELRKETGEEFKCHMEEVGKDGEGRSIYNIKLTTTTSIDLVDFLDGNQDKVDIYVEFV